MRRQVRDPGGGGIHDQGRHLGLLDQRRARDDVGRVDEAGQQVDVLAHDQLLDRDLGGIAARVLGVTLDQLDRVLAEPGVALLLHVEVHGAVDLLGEPRAAAGIGQDHADLDGLGRGESRRERHRQSGSEPRAVLRHLQFPAFLRRVRAYPRLMQVLPEIRCLANGGAPQVRRRRPPCRSGRCDRTARIATMLDAHTRCAHGTPT